MRAYTNLEQSRKLAEILPIESADFHFSANLSPKGFLEIPKWGNPKDANYSAFPCWSLTALIAVFPFWFLIHPTDRKMALRCNYGNEVAVLSDNLVDAFVEMLLKLHELKLL